VRFCSVPCMAKGQEKQLDLELLARLVCDGATAGRMCKELKVDRVTLRRHLRKRGVYSEWAHRRYKKYSAAA
jgi:hypothetical protein